MSDHPLSDCQFCSVISKFNHEDPIGTAEPCDVWLIAEIPLPWTEKRLKTDPVLQQLYDLFQKLSEQPVQVSLIAIAPDPEYSVPGYTRVLHYQRPAKSFAQFNQQDFLIPEEQLPQLATILLMQPDQLCKFRTIQTAHPLRPRHHGLYARQCRCRLCSVWLSHLQKATSELCS